MTSSADTPSSTATIELSAYELQKTPQEVITDPCAATAVVPRCLYHDFMCPICLGLLDKTMVFGGCLHRFCLDCIVTAFHYGFTDCPSCLQKNVVGQPLRPDLHFDQLISTIYPNRDVYDEHQISALRKLFDQPCFECFMATVHQSIKIK